MSTNETPKPKDPAVPDKVTASEVAENLAAEMDVRDESRITSERSQRQDLTQGMDTGTHDSIHRGVDWRPEFSVHTRPTPPAAPEEPKDKKDKSD
jgi:hypothetical protein